MSKSDFDAFVERHKVKQQEEAAFDPKRQLDEWSHYLDLLCSEVSKFLENYISKTNQPKSIIGTSAYP